MTDTFALAEHPEFAANGDFAHLPLGATLRQDPKTIKLAEFFDFEAALPHVPSKVDLTKPVASWPMYGNDTLGDCTCAAAGHMVQGWTAANGHELTPLEAAIIGLYDKTGDHTDDGRVETDVLNYWRKHGLGSGSHKITAYAYIDPRNIAHVKAAIYFFGGVYTGIALPLTAQRQQVWDVVGDGKTGPSQPGSWGGHAVPYEAFDSHGIVPVTWGALIKATWAFHSAYTEECYAIISPDWFKSGKTPQGLNLTQLEAAVQALTA